MSNSNVRDFWEKIDDKFSHRDEYREGGPNLQTRNPNLHFAAEKVAWENAKVLEYGCGGGHIGKFLLDDGKISKYTGLDISRITLQAAQERLKDYKDRVSFKRVDQFSRELAKEQDVFISVAVIQHFPSLVYTEEFFEELNHSGIKQLLIQYRWCENGALFNASAYEKGTWPEGRKEVQHAVYLSDHWVQTHLHRYVLNWISEVDPKTKYQYAYFILPNLLENSV